MGNPGLNQHHEPAVRFVTLAHELGHLFLGHLGEDKARKVSARADLWHSQEELEAESVAYLVCKRNGVESKSKTYLATFVEQNTTVKQIDVYRVMRAAGMVEALLGLGAQSKI
jgi:antirestriction protein ArdC